MLKRLKYLKIGLCELAALLIILFATSLRILMVGLGWPQTNSDEDTIGIMALHIAYHGGHPIFFYGQNYMGSLEAYLGAALFHLFGASVFTLRLGMIIIFALFLASTYFLTSLLYTKRMALISLILLSLGSRVFFAEELTAIGGYAETLLFGSLAFLLAAWLSLSQPTSGQDLSSRKRWLRFVGLACRRSNATTKEATQPAARQGVVVRMVGFGCWGLVVGLGLWSDFLILPFVLMASLLLLVGCWRELRRWAILFLLVGLVLGAFPLIAYNVTASPGQNSWTVLRKLDQDGSALLPHNQNTLVLGIEETLSVTIPLSTGASPLCFNAEIRKFGNPEPHTLQCTLIHLSWGIGYVALWAIAVLLAVRALWKLRGIWRNSRSKSWAFETRQSFICHFARLMLLGSTGLALALYIVSPTAVLRPISTRYLIGLLITLPAVISPLLEAIPTRAKASSHPPLPWIFIQRGVLLLIGLTLLMGTISIFSEEVPRTSAINQQQYALVDDLLRIGARHIYSEYWTCNRIAFQSREQIICAVLGRDLQPTHNRYLPYLAIVSADPSTAYVFPIGSPEAAASARKAALSGGQYRYFAFDGYVIYQPVGAQGSLSAHSSTSTDLISSTTSTSSSTGSRMSISSLPSTTLT